ncbi:MAG: HEAT repeat domain-containing protein, partial [Planctomycetota bacterium]
ENFGWAGGIPGDRASRYWVRKGVDPVSALNRILARRDKSFGAAAFYLTELEPETQSAAVPELIAALNDGIDHSERPPYDSLRGLAAQSLGEFGATAKAAVPALVQRLKDENGYIRVDAAVALWRIEQHPAAVPALIAELKHEDRSIRGQAVSNLGDIAAAENSSDVIPALLSTFENDEDADVRRAAAYALAATGDLAESAVSALTSALYDENEEIRRAARDAIAMIFGRTAAPPWSDVYARAAYYSRNKEWEKALTWWQAHIPRRLLADPWPSLRYEHIAQCQLQLGKRAEASVTILENVEVAPFWILELVDAYRLHNELPDLENYANDLMLSEEQLPEGPEVVKRAKIVHEYIRMVRMAEAGDAAGLWDLIELPSWDTAINPFDPSNFEFDRSAKAKDLLLSIPVQARPLLLSKLKHMPADKADSQSRREQRLAIVLLGRLGAVEILPFIRGEFETDLDQYSATDYFYAALNLGTGEAFAFVKAYATRPEHQEYRFTAKEVLDDWQTQKPGH